MVRQPYFSSLILEPFLIFRKKKCAIFKRCLKLGEKKFPTIYILPKRKHIVDVLVSGKKYNLKLKKKVYIICCHNFVVFGAYPPFAESFKQLMFA